MGNTELKCKSDIDRKIHELELIVPDFRKLSKYKVGCCKTMYFQLYGPDECSEFSLNIYPHGFNERTGSYVSLWLKKESKREMSVSFTCSIADEMGWTVCKKSAKQNLALESVVGWASFCLRDIILDTENGALKDGNLHLICEVEIHQYNALPNAVIEDDTSHVMSLSDLSTSFQQLLKDSSFTDFDLNVGDKKLQVHKAVLAARSPVFKRMLESLSMKDQNGIDITDITYEALEEFVKYIYTGRPDYLSIPMAMEIYYTADKYEVNMLKQICSTLLCKSVLIDNVIEILLLAFRHCDLELKHSCLNFISKNLREVKGTTGWINLMKSHPKLADKALFFHET